MPFFIDQIILFIVSLISNMLSSMAGGGAGLLQLPILIFLGLPFATALATHKIATVALGVGATLKYRKSEFYEKTFIFLVLGAGLPGVILGANAILAVSPTTAKIALGLLTTGLGIFSIVKKQLGQTYHPIHRDIRGVCVGALGIFIIGFLNGSLSSGTGMFVTLWLIVWFGMDYKRAVAYTMLLVGFFWNATGAMSFALLAPPKWEWLPVLLIASMLGGYIGTHVAMKNGNRFIKRIFEVMTISVGLGLLFTALNTA